MKLTEEGKTIIWELFLGAMFFVLGLAAAHVWITPPLPKPVQVSFSLEGAGICKATGGGKTWLVVDMTHEFLLPEEVEEKTE